MTLPPQAPSIRRRAVGRFLKRLGNVIDVLRMQERIKDMADLPSMERKKLNTRIRGGSGHL